MFKSSQTMCFIASFVLLPGLMFIYFFRIILSFTSYLLLKLREMCFLPSTLSRNIEGVTPNVLVLLPKAIAFYIRLVLVLVKRQVPGRNFKVCIVDFPR